MWLCARRKRTKSLYSHYRKGIDPQTAAYELHGCKAAFRDLGLIDRDARAVSPDHFAPGMVSDVAGN